MSALRHQERDEQTINDSDVAHSGVSPVAPAPNWLREIDTEPAPPEDIEEDQFWNTPPRYSVVNLASLAPSPIAAPPAPKHAWAARLLFATIACAVVGLLVLELRSLGKRA